MIAYYETLLTEDESQKKMAHSVIYLHTVWPRLMLLRLRPQRPNSESCAEFCL